MKRSLQRRIFQAMLSVAFVTLLVGMGAAISLHFIARDVEQLAGSDWPFTDAVHELNLALQKSNLGLERFLDGDLDNARAVIGHARGRVEYELERIDANGGLSPGSYGEVTDVIIRMFEEQDRLLGLREIDELTARQLARSWRRIGESFSPLVELLADDRGVSADLLGSTMELHHQLSLANGDHDRVPYGRVIQLVEWIKALPSYSHYASQVSPYLVLAERHAALAREHQENAHKMTTLRRSVEMLGTQLDRRLARLEAESRTRMLHASGNAIELTSQTRTLLVLGILVAALLTLLLSRRLARAIGEPLRQLGHAVTHFSRDRSQRIDLRTGDELQTLAESFNDMADSLQKTTVARDHFDDIITSMLDGLFVVDGTGHILLANLAGQQLAGADAGELIGVPFADLLVPASQGRWTASNRTHLAAGELALLRPDGTAIPVLFSRARLNDAHDVDSDSVVVLRDIRLQKEQEATLRQANEDAEQGARARSEFLANISHEVRTPLNGVIGMLQLLRSTPQNDEQRDYTQTAHQSALALLRLLDEILDLTRLSSGRLALEAAPFSVAELVEEVVHVYAPQAATKGLELASHVDARAPSVVIGDPARIRQILVNLVGNAVKFTDDGRVGLEVTACDDDTLEFAVSDTGIGIDKHAQEHLFEDFSQADGSASRRHGGAGLGLSIVRQLTSLMNGQIDYTSAPGQGSTFRVRLPLPACPEVARPPAGGDHAGRRLLLAEADPLVRAQFAEWLSCSGAEVTSHATLDQALLEVASHDDPPDLMLVDLQLLAQADPAVRFRLTVLWQEAGLNLSLLTPPGSAIDPDLGPLAEAPRLDKPLTRDTLRAGLARALRAPREPAQTAPIPPVPGLPAGNEAVP